MVRISWIGEFISEYTLFIRFEDMTNRFFSYTQLLHTKEGQAFADKVWYDTYRELSFVHVDGILKSL